MIKALKQLARSILWALKLDITKNLQYDRQTLEIMKRVLKPGSNCVDVGCHKGEILDLFIELSPKGTHYAFEPIPVMFNALKQKFRGKNVQLFQLALSFEKGNTTFNHVRNAPAYSGLKQRRYDTQNPDIEVIPVEIDVLDNIVAANTKIDLIKIDVEGGEFGVIRGGINTIKHSRPHIVFECGLGGSDFYGTKPDDIFGFITNECSLKINTLKGFLDNKGQLSLDEFSAYFNDNTEYYFIAYP